MNVSSRLPRRNWNFTQKDLQLDVVSPLVLLTVIFIDHLSAEKEDVVIFTSEENSLGNGLLRIGEDDGVRNEERVGAQDPEPVKAIDERDYGHGGGISCAHWSLLRQLTVTVLAQPEGVILRLFCENTCLAGLV